MKLVPRFRRRATSTHAANVQHERPRGITRARALWHIEMELEGWYKAHPGNKRWPRRFKAALVRWMELAETEAPITPREVGAIAHNVRRRLAR